MKIGLFCEADDRRRELILAIEEQGHRVTYAAGMREALELVSLEHPQVMVVSAEPSERSAEAFLAEAGRLDPALPVLVALSRRDAARAVDLMRMGACEVAGPPWTRENLAACLAKAARFRGTVLEVLQPLERAGHAAFYFAAVAVFLGVALGYAALERRRQMEVQAKSETASRWDLPYDHPAGLAFDGKRLWIADWYSQALYVHDPRSLALVKTVYLPAATPISIAFGGDALWTVSAAGQIRKQMLDDRLTLLSMPGDAFPHTVAVAYDGLYLWTVNNLHRAEHVLRKHLVDERLTVIASYPYPGVKPAALAFDGRHLWSLDAGNRELLEHDLNDPRILLARVPLREYQSGLWRPMGLAWDGSEFWSVAESAGKDERPGRLFRHGARRDNAPGAARAEHDLARGAPAGAGP